MGKNFVYSLNPAAAKPLQIVRIINRARIRQKQQKKREREEQQKAKYAEQISLRKNTNKHTTNKKIDLVCYIKKGGETRKRNEQSRANVSLLWLAFIKLCAKEFENITVNIV